MVYQEVAVFGSDEGGSSQGRDSDIEELVSGFAEDGDGLEEGRGLTSVDRNFQELLV